MTAPAQWICCQLGAREHYAVPRALHQAGRLRELITDAWVEPGSVWTRVPGGAAQRLAERWHSDLAGVAVREFGAALLAREALWRSQADGWARLMKRNEWYGKRAAAALKTTAVGGANVTVFAHSYSAREVLEVAKARGFQTILGQIDPGPEHFRLAERAAAERPEYGAPPVPPPPLYFDAWREECRLADRIVVNSEWSREMLERAGVSSAKLRLAPLAYAAPAEGTSPRRDYPPHFTAARRLRLLFVGHVSVVKGAAALLEAVHLLADVHVEVRFVGALAMRVPARFQPHPAVRWIGAVSRREVMQHYRDADVLIFPSLSDGFGMAQIEAQGWRLPVVASRSCGRVVRHRENGLLLPDSSPAAIANAVRELAADPQLLRKFSCASITNSEGLSALSSALVQLETS